MNSMPYRYMMLNAVDMLMVLAGHSIQGGIPLDVRMSHTVLMTKYTHITKSLVDKYGTTHTGPPKCLGTFNYSSVRKMMLVK